MSAIELFLFTLMFGGSLAAWAWIASRLAQGRHPLGADEPLRSEPAMAEPRLVEPSPLDPPQVIPAPPHCPVCGTQVVESAVNCPACGEPLCLAVATPDPSRWNPVAVGLAFAWIGLNAFALATRFGQEALEPTLGDVQMVCVVNGVLVGVLLIALGGFGKVRLAAFGIHLRDWARNIRAGTVGFLAALLPVYVLQILLAETGLRSEGDMNPILKLLTENSVPEVVFWIGVSVVFSAPLAEELVYRVILQGWLAGRMAAGWAIVIASALFSMAHGWPDLLPLFPLALVLGYVFHRTRSYLAVVTLHALFNGLNFGLSLLRMSGEQAEPVLGLCRRILG